MSDWCVIEDAKPKKRGDITPRQVAERGLEAAKKVLAKGIKDNNRHYDSIGFMGWGIGAGTPERSIRVLTSFSNLNPNCREVAYLKAHLPIDAYYINPKTREKKTYLNIVIRNLPSPIKGLPIEMQVRFICMAMALLQQENKFRPGCTSPAGAKGAMQLTADTVKQMLLDYGRQIGRVVNIFRPEDNIKVGLWLLYDLLSTPLVKDGKPTKDRVYNPDAATITLAFTKYNKGKYAKLTKPTSEYQQQVELKYQLYYKLYADQVKAALEPTQIADTRPVSPAR